MKPKQRERERQRKLKKLGVLEKEWIDYRMLIMPAEVPDIQAVETRNAFYSGAGCLFYAIMNILDEDREPTEHDLAVMDGIHKEIEGFVDEKKAEDALMNFVSRSKKRAMN